MKFSVTNLKNTVLDTIFPVCCPVCGDVVVPKGRRICGECRRRLPYLSGPLCFKCGQPVSDDTAEYCETCKNGERSFERGVAVFEYDELLRRMIGDFKFRGHKDYAYFFADELKIRFSRMLSGLGIQALVPVPVHPSKKKFRGYNQSEILCELLSNPLDLPIYKALTRMKKTEPQKGLDPASRRKNLTDALSFVEPKEFLEANYKPERVVLVDDIFTTGATAEACSDVLKANGVREVYLLNISIVNNIN